MKQQQAIIFDLGGVLLKEPERHLASVLPAELTQAAGQMRIFNRLFEFIYHAHGNDYKRDWFLGNRPSAAVVQAVVEHIDLPIHAPFFKSEAERQLIKQGAEYVILPHHLANLTYLDEEGMLFVNTAKGLGIRVLILSNWDPESCALLRKKFPDLFALFDEQDIFVPQVTGYMKPEAACYDFVVKQAGLDVGTTLFIDDGATNVKAAQDFGMQGLLHADWKATGNVLKGL